MNTTSLRVLFSRSPARHRTRAVALRAAVVAIAVASLGTLSVSAATLPGVAHHLPADGSAADVVGTAHGTVVGAVGYAPGRFGEAFDLQGGWIDLGPAVGNFGTADFTVAMWISSTSSGHFLVKRPDNTHMLDAQLTPGGQIVVELRGEAASDSRDIFRNLISTQTGLNDGTWRHIAIVRQGSTATLYVDGAVGWTDPGLDDLSFAGEPYASAHLTLGASLLYPGVNLVGLVDDVQFYPSALSQPDVQQLMREPDTTTDTTPPTIVASATSSPNGNGWYAGDVTVVFTCADEGGSGIPAGTCPPAEVLSTEGAAVSSTAQVVVDGAGNASAPSNTVTVAIDRTAPSLSPTIHPSTVFLNSTATAAPGATDALSGIDVASCGPVITATLGPQQVSCTATDLAGNETTTSVAYTVVAKTPKTKADCKAGGWGQVTDHSGKPFKNQGDCVSFVSTNGGNPAAG